MCSFLRQEPDRIKYHDNPVVEAVRHNNKIIAKLLLKYNIGINVRDENNHDVEIEFLLNYHR
jgi:hypothetical protein